MIVQHALFAQGEFGDSHVAAAPPDAALRDLADRLEARWPGRWHLGTSSWHFPGWAGLVWDRYHPAAVLSREGLAAYAAHPLMRCVSLDRRFYRELADEEYRRHDGYAYRREGAGHADRCEPA